MEGVSWIWGSLGILWFSGSAGGEGVPGRVSGGGAVLVNTSGFVWVGAGVLDWGSLSEGRSPFTSISSVGNGIWVAVSTIWGSSSSTPWSWLNVSSDSHSNPWVVVSNTDIFIVDGSLGHGEWWLSVPVLTCSSDSKSGLWMNEWLLHRGSLNIQNPILHLSHGKRWLSIPMLIE